MVEAKMDREFRVTKRARSRVVEQRHLGCAGCRQSWSPVCTPGASADSRHRPTVFEHRVSFFVPRFRYPERAQP